MHVGPLLVKATGYNMLGSEMLSSCIKSIATTKRMCYCYFVEAKASHVTLRVTIWCTAHEYFEVEALLLLFRVSKAVDCLIKRWNALYL